MKKNRTLLCLFALGNLACFAQSDVNVNPKAFTFQVGVNATDFIRQYIIFNSNNLNLPTSPYQVNCKAFRKLNNEGTLKIGLRSGAGYSFIEASQTSNNTASDFITRAEKTDYFFGIELQQSISKRFWVFYGANFYNHIESNHTENWFIFNQFNKEVTITEDKSRYHGITGTLGLQFNINRFININTELVAGFKNGQGSTSVTGSNVQPGGEHDGSGIRETFIHPPSFINVNFMF